MKLEFIDNSNPTRFKLGDRLILRRLEYDTKNIAPPEYTCTFIKAILCKLAPRHTPCSDCSSKSIGFLVTPSDGVGARPVCVCGGFKNSSGEMWWEKIEEEKINNV